jgi:hypothetical protein
MTSYPAHPNFLIIGAAKCGTTSLHFYLAQHPKIWMSLEKELKFFLEEINWNRGVDWYKEQFDARFPLRGEATPYYTHALKYNGVPSRIHSLLPEAKLIYLVRDPIQRILSAYVHAVVWDHEERPFEEAVLASSENSYIDRSRYYFQLSQYLDFFPAKQVLVQCTEDLRDNRQSVLRNIFSFLGVEPYEKCWKYNLLLNQSWVQRKLSSFGRRLSPLPAEEWIQRISRHLHSLYTKIILFPFSMRMPKPELKEDVRRQLVGRLKDDIDKFRALAGLSFSHWSL